MALAGLVALRAVESGLPSAGQLRAACAWALPSRAELAALVVIALAALTLAVVVRGVRSLVRELAAHRRALSRLTVLEAVPRDDLTAWLIDERRPQAFCAGYLRPRAYVSTGAVALLHEPELTAVLHHEAHHARRRDPLRLLVMDVLADALFFLPALSRLRARYAEVAELAADEAAVRAAKDPAPLASALLAFDAGADAGAVGIAPERVDHLLGERTRWDAPVALIAGGVATILALAIVSVSIGRALGSEHLELSTAGARTCTLVMVLAPTLLVVALRSARRRRALRPRS